MTNNKALLLEFHNLTKQEQDEIVEEAREEAYKKQGPLKSKLKWAAFQFAGIALISFVAGFGIATFLSVAEWPSPNYVVVGAAVGIVVVLLGPSLNRKASLWYFGSEIAERVAAQRN